MPKFKIIRENPSQFKQQILQFWEKYLPGTPPRRFEWMQNNPAGAAIWLFALDENTGDVAGTISLFPKDLFNNSQKIRAAIIGDFMVHPKHRVFGPALDLLKAVSSFQKGGEFDLLYTIPNPKSKKIAQKAGFKPAGKCISLMRPQQCNFLLEKYIGSFAAIVLEKPAQLTLQLISRSTYASHSGIFEEIAWHDTALDKFCQQLHSKGMGITGDYRLAYFDWRYRQNPEFNFQILTYKRREGEDIQGVLVFSIERGRLELYDIIAFNKQTTLALLEKITRISKDTKCRGVYSVIYEHNQTLHLLKRCCFFDTKDDIEIYTYPGLTKEKMNWYLTSADRNI